MNDVLVQSVLRGVLGGRTKKRSTKALKYLTGRGTGAGSFVNAGTLLTAAGIAWGIYETMQNQGSAVASGLGGPSSAARPHGSPASPPLPPLPNVGAAAPVDDATRMIRLAVSAANADGSLNEPERAAIAEHAGPDTAALVARELEVRRTLAEIVSGVTDPAQRATLYVLAYTILRADEQVSGAERIYLAQLANLLGLDPAAIQTLEQEIDARIDAVE